MHLEKLVFSSKIAVVGKNINLTHPVHLNLVTVMRSVVSENMGI